MKIITVMILAVLFAGCTTPPPLDIIRAGKCQWVREEGDITYSHYGKCNNPEHREWDIKQR
jgi:hypothetical protein